jgi:hypothetical protein
MIMFRHIYFGMLGRRFNCLCISLCSLCLCGLNHIASSAGLSRPSAKSTLAICTRWHQPSNPLDECHFSGINRNARRHKMSIRWHQPSFPPDNSADYMQQLRRRSPLGRMLCKLCILCIKYRIARVRLSLTDYRIVTGCPFRRADS